eukprot:1153947-Pelagomonas_calceolata.AAC.3
MHLEGGGPVGHGAVPGGAQLVLLGPCLILRVQGDPIAGLQVCRGHKVCQGLGLVQRGIAQL